MKHTRRSLLKKTVFGTGSLGLRALATGLPGLLPGPAAGGPAPRTSPAGTRSRAQYLILSTSSAGDPLNANVPGTYDFPDIAHSPDPRMAPTDFALGGQTVRAAQVWSTLPPWVLERTSFIHHATLTNNHANLPKVLRLMGATAKQEMLPSIVAKFLAPCFGTVQVDPVSAGRGRHPHHRRARPAQHRAHRPARSAGPSQHPARAAAAGARLRRSTRSTPCSRSRAPRPSGSTWTAWCSRGGRRARWAPTWSTCWAAITEQRRRGADRRRRWRSSR